MSLEVAPQLPNLETWPGFSSGPLSVSHRSQATADWDKILELSGDDRAYYSQDLMDYFISYLAGVSGPNAQFQDLSAVFYWNGTPACIFPIFVSVEPKFFIGIEGFGLVPPLFVKTLSPNSVRSITKSILCYIEETCGNFGSSKFKGITFLEAGAISPWHRLLAEAGATFTLAHDLYVDLTQPLESIFQNFRKSYRPLIKKAESLWQCQVTSKDDYKTFEEFRRLHIEVAGRETRPRSTWDVQWKAIQNDAAFLVTLRDSEKLIGGGYFSYSRSEVLYGVGAYNRDLFDLPLGHLVQYRAIAHMKILNKTRYFLGLRSYPGDVMAPSDKEISISHFKEGFSSRIEPRFLFEMNINQTPKNGDQP